MFLFNVIIKCDAPSYMQLGMQDPATPIAEGILFFHNHLFSFLLGIAFFVFYLLFKCIFLFKEQSYPIASKLLHNSILEIVWTLLPAFILIFIAVPSFTLLYASDELMDPEFNIKIMGHQWYWSYEMYDFKKDFNTKNVEYTFDSYMLPENELPLGFFRNLEVDNRLVIPMFYNLRFLITSLDVIHSWAIPSLGIKVDATPGRLLQVPCYLNRASIFYGQCSEICGINHAFMPIVIVGINFYDFTTYIFTKISLIDITPMWVALDATIPIVYIKKNV